MQILVRTRACATVSIGAQAARLPQLQIIIKVGSTGGMCCDVKSSYNVRGDRSE